MDSTKCMDHLSRVVKFLKKPACQVMKLINQFSSQFTKAGIAVFGNQPLNVILRKTPNHSASALAASSISFVYMPSGNCDYLKYRYIRVCMIATLSVQRPDKAFWSVTRARTKEKDYAGEWRVLYTALLKVPIYPQKYQCDKKMKAFLRSEYRCGFLSQVCRSSLMYYRGCASPAVTCMACQWQIWPVHRTRVLRDSSCQVLLYCTSYHIAID
jgi:hypothetical protein